MLSLYRGMTRELWKCLASGLVIGVLACDPVDQAGLDDRISLDQGDPVSTTLLVTLRPSLTGPVALDYPKSIDGHEDTLMVVDRSNGVVMLDGSLTPLGVVGRLGDGPGEFDGPTAIEYRDSTWTVVDPGNQRITRLSRAGAITEEASVSVPMTAGIPIGEAVVFPAASETHYLRYVSPDTSYLWGERSSAVAAWTDVEAALAFDRVALASDGVFVLDVRTGSIFRYALEGGLPVREWSLPDDLRRDLFRNTGFGDPGDFPGAMVRYAPPFRGFDVRDDGRFAVLVPNGGNSMGTEPILIDLESGTWRRLLLRAPADPQTRHAHIAAVRIVGDDLLILEDFRTSVVSRLTVDWPAASKD